jgi:OmcA/MtrC family decaheme c-type cytochrome
MCHTDQNVDPESGNSLNMQVMIHKIHSGAALPSVQAGDTYHIVGFRQNVFDFSAGTWPQDTRNCTTCHTGPDGANFQTAPNIAACTSCHDDVNLATGENHPGGEQEDGSCSNCHQPEGEEFDASIVGAHTIPLNSTQVTGITLEIVSVEGAVPGGSPIVTFKVTDSGGNAIAPADMGYLALTLAGPTTDYVNRVTETVFRAPSDTPPVVEDAGSGAYRYTFTYTLPTDATGTTRWVWKAM